MSKIVKAYYDGKAEAEWQRLENPYSCIEFISTMSLIAKYFPKEGCICDIGSGPGRYSIELLKNGYKVTLLELSEQELKLAEEKIEGLGFRAEQYICDSAENLHILESERYDAVLLMGPMYHILEDSDRKDILENTMRILKKGGVAIIAYLNSWGILKAGISEFSHMFSEIESVYGYLNEQKFSAEMAFTESYFTTPVKALAEVKAAGFDVITYAGAESFVAGMRNEIVRLYNENRPVYENFMKAAAETCEYPQYRDATEHLHIVVRK